ncbi:hypothetical protein [Pseudoroseicyclus aestuarii]|uniref:Flagellar motor switch protein n=1 Tax=Pseudoroseicyclus aestuarii TaxID=1795041 RepID=A0A318SXF3_9RHOB|nr:hypothetical protein [Pseudoroseicyclus aestuarii]PYE84507.1 hypothetical protein DFP88_102307 [Pseudoroseicyclus aestuarii]
MAQLIDGVILMLLAGTLGYTALVDRRMRRLLAALSALEPVIGRFSADVDRSQVSAAALREAAGRMAPRETEEPRAAATAPQRTGRLGARLALGRRRSPVPEPAAAVPEAAQTPAADGDIATPTAPAAPLPAGGGAQAAQEMIRGEPKSDLVRQFFEKTRSIEA